MDFATIALAVSTANAAAALILTVAKIRERWARRHRPDSERRARPRSSRPRELV